MSLSHIFSPRPAQLANCALTQAGLPGSWRASVHPYTNQAQRPLFRSEDGVWGVANKRSLPSALSELLISRLAIHAGVPVAPVFYQKSEDYCHHLISVVPFDHLLPGTSMHSRDINTVRRHFSASLPFFLWISDFNDRGAVNRCSNADDVDQISEYDFAGSNLSDAFAASMLKEEEISDTLRPVYRRSFETNILNRRISAPFENLDMYRMILRPEFEDGMARLMRLPDDIVGRTLRVLARTLPVSELQHEAIPLYFAQRMQDLLTAHRLGQFDAHMVDTLPVMPPIGNFSLPNAKTYRFR